MSNINNIPEPVLNRLKAIAARAERGYLEEAQAAQKILERELKKHNITIEELLEKDVLIERRFKWRFTWEKRLFYQLAYKLNIPDDKTGRIVNRDTGRPYKELWIEASADVAFDFSEQFDFYKKLFEQELETFVSAFIQAQKMFPEKPSSEALSRNDIDLEQLERILMMSQGIKKETYHKRLKGG